MTESKKRKYHSRLRDKAAGDTRRRVLDAARALFSKHGIDGTPISAIAKRAGSSDSTVYALFGGKEGMLAAIMEESLFGADFDAARGLLEGETDPVRLIALSAKVARAIYDGERREMGLIRAASAFSAGLRAQEQRFEAMRMEMQRDRVTALFDAGRQRADLTEAEAQRLLWMYTSRDVYRMLVVDGGWEPDRYEGWLARTLVETLTDDGSAGV